MIKLFTIFLFFIQGSFLFCQVNIDSLLLIIDSTADDSIKFENYIKVIQDVRFSDLEKTKLYCEEVYKIGKRYKPAHVTAMADYYLGYYYKVKGKSNEALELYDKVVKYGQVSNNPNFEAAALNDMATIYQFEGNNEAALKSYFKVRDIYIEIGHLDGQLVVESNIGLLYQSLEDNTNALNYYKIAFAKAVKHKSKYNEEILAGNIASVYAATEKYDSAKYYANYCLGIAVELNYERSIGFANYLLATIEMKENNFSEGLVYGNKALTAYQKIDDKLLLIELYAVLSELYIGTKDYKKAELYSRLVLETSGDLNYTEGMMKGHFVLSKIKEEQGLFKNALSSFKEYKDYSDTIFNHAKIESINELQVKYETANKDLEIKNQDLEIIKKTSQRNVFMGGLIFLLLVALFLWYKNILQKKLSSSKIKSLESEQKFLAADFILQGQEEERKRIATDLHDGLGGILATAKLQLQNIHKEIDKLQDLNLMAQAENLIGDAYSEVRRIAHDMMPSALINLGFKSAVEDLSDKINLSSNIVFKTQFYAMADDMHEKTAVTLYRITQEAINNTLKHANADNIILQFSETDSSYLLTIEDDGDGFDVADKNKFSGLGIKNIQSRINYLNGELNIWSERGKGTGYEIVVPQ